MSFRTSFAALSFLALIAMPARAENIPLDHPVVAMVKTYLTAVVDQDWKTAASMLLPTSLDRKQKETISIIKMAPTMTDETQMLERLGVKDISELEKMDAQEFYVADRSAVHKKMGISDEVKKKKKDSLKINVIGLCGEDENRVLHATVRTSQETLETKIEELFLISLVQDKTDPKKWVVVPDMMRPLTTSLKTGEETKPEGADAGKK
jgi:hypothetical protein